MSPIALIGYRATGKTTIGRSLAAELDREWVDTDAEIISRAGRSIAAIFAEDGEQAFRDLETAVLRDVSARGNVVLSCGGGIVLKDENRACLVERCQPIIWLRASVQTIAQRMAADAHSVEQRPNLTSQGGEAEIEQVLAQRLPLYEACATASIDTESRSTTDLVEQALRLCS